MRWVENRSSQLLPWQSSRARKSLIQSHAIPTDLIKYLIAEDEISLLNLIAFSSGSDEILFPNIQPFAEEKAERTSSSKRDVPSQVHDSFSIQ
jgi:hypothetical protein